MQLENELRELEEKIDAEKRANVTIVDYDFEKIKANISTKEKEVQELEAELEKQRRISE